MLTIKDFEDKLGDWTLYFKNFILSGGMDKIYSQLKVDNQVGRVCPESKNVFRGFLETPP
jgi:hypothetical protein